MHEQNKIKEKEAIGGTFSTKWREREFIQHTGGEKLKERGGFEYLIVNWRILLKLI